MKPIDRETERGAALAEFTFVLPIFVILVFGIIQFGLALNQVQAYQAAAREGARVGALQTSSSADINNAVTGSLVGIGGATPSVTNPSGTCAGRPGQQITVRVTAPYTIQIPLLPDVSITLEGDGVFRCE
ncbi:MAG: TadE/TadG family type IV pilus assembly protein [Acidimicrobiales bacterium]